MPETPFTVTMRVGTVERVEAFPEARKDHLCKLWIDLGDETVQSAAQLLGHHTLDELDGMQVIVATDLGTVNIAGFESEVLTVGVPGDDGLPVLVTPTEPVPDGGTLH